MADFEYGPVDLYLVGFQGDRPDPGTIQAIGDLIEGGEIRLLDLVIISHQQDGEISVTEYEEVYDEFGFPAAVLEATGLVGDEDIEALAEQIPRGTSGAVLAIELLWAKRLASRFAETGGVVLQAERIPAPIVNAVLAEAEEE